MWLKVFTSQNIPRDLSVLRDVLSYGLLEAAGFPEWERIPALGQEYEKVFTNKG